MAGLEEVVSLCGRLDDSMVVTVDSAQRRQLIRDHLESVDKLKFIIPDFTRDLEWLNVSEPLYLTNQLAGKVLVLDFFTYCCINCMHVLPDLHHLGSKFKVKDGVVIVGVHSAKFLNEKLTANILSAVLRYNINHPVVNDADASLWQQLQITCWPTFLLVGPDGQYIYSMAGEGHRDKLVEFVEIALEHYKVKGQVKDTDIRLHLERMNLSESPLRFPGKVCLSEEGNLVVADTGNNRVLVLDAKTGVVQTVIGGSEQGFEDGNLVQARFSSPQGVATVDSQIYVADTENHAIRLIDLVNGMVTTIAGTGQQGHDLEGGHEGTSQEISSPWDLVLDWEESGAGHSSGNGGPNLLYIAMAGTHQIWVYFLKDSKWYKGSEHRAGSCLRFAGSGREENRNNSYPGNAAFAQPSGLALSPCGKLHTLYVADAESSSVRMITLRDGCVKALVGGERDPRNLFAFGDVDGVGVSAKLQHPLAVAMVTDEGPLLVADSYNHKIKTIDLVTKECTTIIGSDQGRQLNEPGGMCVDQKQKLVYIADTNNHCIKVYDMETTSLTQLPVIFDKPSATKKVNMADLTLEFDCVQKSVRVKLGNQLHITLTLDLEAGSHLNEDAPNSWKVISNDETGNQIISLDSTSNTSKGKLKPTTSQTVTRFRIPETMSNIKADFIFTFQLFVCRLDDTCTVKQVTTLLPVVVSESGKDEAIADIHLTVPS